MRRIPATVLAFVVLAAAPALAAQDSAATTAPGVVARGTIPEFRAGQWGALFASSDGFYGIGALRFSTPTKAWTLSGNLMAQHNSQDPGDYRGNHFTAGLLAGRRWFRPGAGRVRPYTELGVNGGYTWGKSESSGYSSTWQGYTAGLYGQIGAQIFFAPELSLGAAWNASLNYHHDHTESSSGGNPSSSRDWDSFSAEGGRVQLVGTLYF